MAFNYPIRKRLTREERQAQREERQAQNKALNEKYYAEIRLHLTATARRWGDATWVFGVPDPLWQIQIYHRAAGAAEFGVDLIGTLKDALRHHPSSPRICTIKDLYHQAKAKVLNGGPCGDPAKEDPDGLGFVEWEPVIYVAGETPFEALTVIRLILEQKVREDRLPQLPSLHLVYPLAPGEKVPEGQLPRFWTAAPAAAPRQEPNDHASLPDPFSVLPPCQNRRHVLGHLQIAAKKGPTGDKLYNFKIFGGIGKFTNGFGRLRVPLTKTTVPTHPGTDMARTVRNIDGGLKIRTYIDRILREALCGVPLLLFTEVEDKHDCFVAWLLERPSIILSCHFQSESMEKEEAEEMKPAASQEQSIASSAADV